MNVFVSTRESVERIKDIISSEVQGCIYDHHVANALGMDAGALRMAIARDKTPVKEIAQFCYEKELIVNDLVFEEKLDKITEIKKV